MKLLPVEPIGEHEAVCGCNGLEPRTVKIKEYPNQERCEELRRRRTGRDGGTFMSIRQAAAKLGITAVEYSAIELGAAEPEDWDGMLTMLFPGVRT